ncbi:MAG: hypothetical protein HYV33_00955 [Candidatus Kerfeldbacteria bacterium]|nr:hypothetical protein [Candidatus Kerfeldbacteria bacterium]
MNYLRDVIVNITTWVEDLTETQRRIVLATGILLMAAILGVIIFWLFFKPLLPEPTVNINGQLINVNQLPEIINNANRGVINDNVAGLPTFTETANGGNTLAQVIYNNDAQNVVLSGDGDTVQYYDAATGRFYRIDANGNVVQLGEAVFKGVEQATWSHDANKAVLELQDGFNILYDFERDQQYTLHEDMQEFDFSPTDDQISFKFMADNPQDRWLGTANIDGSGALGIEPLGENGDRVLAEWSPSGQAIGAYSEFIDADTKKVIPIGLKGENFKDFIVEGRGFNYQWSNNGRQMLYSTYTAENNYNSTLHIVDAYGDTIGDNNKSLNLNTSVDKCTFNKVGSTVYCAVPVNPPAGGGIAPSLLNNVPHDIYKIDIHQGIAVKLATPADPIAGTNLNGPTDLLVTDNEDVLYYREANTGRLRRIVL